MIIINKSGIEIKRWEDWEKPESKDQWVQGRSAMELAKSWFKDSVPTPPSNLIDALSQKFDGKIKFIKAHPEIITSLPYGRSDSGRHHDLLVYSLIHDEKVSLCIDAKADEPFDVMTIKKYRDSLKTRTKGKKSYLPDRIEALLKMLPLPFTNVEEHPVAKNGYQLLTGLTGTAKQAKMDKSSSAIFLVHEFHTDKTKKKKLDKNEQDYVSFVRAIFEDESLDCSAGNILGPIMVDGMKCYIGKIITSFS